ncbi:caspase domain-containing protein [Mycena albidolilacea]|uniref:Caspase domain-containing protein n=1 Tax=Mycena albidolilacea TaxID=1033008 RepID=A0AAD7EEK2_9AGAR|nr:caspase domain-containing protein [Mycena albidolilacea]
MNINSASTECGVFALIIGIDEYSSPRIPNLGGCVNDANAFKNYLTDSLNVLDSPEHIKLLTNAAAQREDILKAFNTHLINNDRIRNIASGGDITQGDTIIVFFAGHGSDPKTCENMFAPRGIAETICPYDQMADDSVEQEGLSHGIPHYTVNHLFRKLAEKKGNNITAIFDSCHSGGVSREKSTARYCSSVAPIPAELDHALLFDGKSFPFRAMNEEIPTGFKHRRMGSHVLLAACRDSQRAHETWSTGESRVRGRFSESLERNLKKANLETTTYRDIIDRVDRWTFQEPQVEGEHKDRLLFNGTYPHRPGSSWPIIKGASPGCIRVAVGSVEGVVMETEFRVECTTNSTVGYFRVHKVELDYSDLEAKSKNTHPIAQFIPGEAKAKVSSWNNDQMVLRVFPDSTTDNVIGETTNRRFIKTNRETAHIELSQSIPGSFVVTWLSGTLQEFIPGGTALSLKPGILLADAIDVVAHFNYFLNVHHGGTPIEGVTFEMHVLEGELFKGRMRVGENLIKAKVAHVQEGVRYGITVYNQSQYILYAYLFYFDADNFSIQDWTDPHMQTPLGPTPPHRKECAFGYGPNVGAFQFILPDGKKEDAGFLKLVVSTKRLNSHLIKQESPFNDIAGRFKFEREKLDEGDVWGTDSIVIIAKRD